MKEKSGRVHEEGADAMEKETKLNDAEIVRKERKEIKRRISCIMSGFVVVCIS